jgi:chromosome segregation ATPase
VLARNRDEQKTHCESLQTKLQEAEENIQKLKEALSSKDAAFDEMKEHLEIPLRKVIESLSSKLL